MSRLMLASALAAFGYLLVFAAVDQGGKFSTRPWDALHTAV